MLDQRRESVLQVLVAEYIRSGEPVSSRSIAESAVLGVSSATIRNDLVQLEQAGYIAQVHTSSGRIPTERGLRYFVDHSDPVRLQAATRERIHSFFGTVHHELRQLLRATSEFLSDLTAYPALVMGPQLASEVIKGVQFIRLSTNTVLLVVVSSAGGVRQELIRFDQPVEDQPLDSIEAELRRDLIGVPFDQAAARLRPDGEEASAISRALESVFEPTQEAELFVGGAHQLTHLWEDLSQVERILHLLEQGEALAQLVESAAAEGTTVLIGSELGVGDVDDLAIISAGYGREQGAHGRVAVLGPTRMNYPRAISVVEQVGEGLSSSLP